MKLSLLFLAANPTDTTRLRIDEEMRSISHALRSADFRDQFELIIHPAVHVSDLQELLLRHRPQIVHFSGHGTGEMGIILQNAAGVAQLVPTAALGDLFALVNTTVRCVVLNACYSIEQAKAIAAHIDCVIGIPNTIDDDAALAFATAFYNALGYGQTVDSAFRLACNALDLQALNDIQKPQLLGRADPTQVRLVNTHRAIEAENISGYCTTVPIDPAQSVASVILSGKLRLSQMWQISLFFVISLLVDLLGNVIASYIDPVFRFAPWAAVLLYLVLSFFLLGRDLVADGLQLAGVAQLRAQIWQCRRLLLLMIPFAVLLWVVSAGLDQLWTQPLCPARQACVLVARFDLPSNPPVASINAADEIEAKLVDQIEVAAGAVPIHVQAIAPINSESAAEELAREHNALLVVWGYILTEEGVTQVYFHLSDRLGLAENQEIRPFRIQPIGETTFTQPVECSSNCIRLSGAITQRTQLITHFVAGLVQYTQEQPATDNFLAALHCAGALLASDPLLERIDRTCVDVEQPPNLNLGLLNYYAGRALFTEGNYVAAERFLLAAAEATPSDPAAYLGLAAIYRNWLLADDASLRLDALAEAEQRLAQVSPGDATLENQIAVAQTKGLIAEMLGEYSEAAHHYQAMIEYFDNDNEHSYTALVNLGRVQRRSDATSAEQTLLRAATLVPTVPWAHLELAQLYVDDRGKAEARLQQAASSATSESWVDVVWAQLCRHWEDFTCAETHYTAASKQRPLWSWLHSQIGDYYRIARSPTGVEYWEQAEKEYRRAVELRTCDPWAHQRLAYILAIRPQPDYRSAAYHYQQSLLLLHPETTTAVVESIKSGLQQALAKSDTPVDLPAEPPAFCK